MNALPRALRGALGLAIAGFLAGCQTPVHPEDAAGYPESARGLHRVPDYPLPDFPDPLEPWNRSASLFNHAVMLAVVDPAARVYRLAVPRPARASLWRFSTNLLYPQRALAFVCQGDLRGAWDETRRFGVNTTVGVLGLFDPATRLGIPWSDEDFGEVFRSWGWKSSSFLVVPLFGPSTVRDASGLVFDALTNPTLYLPPYVGAPLVLNEQSDLVEPYKQFVRTTYDPYHFGRLIWTIAREKRAARYRPKPADTAAAQTLQVAYLAPRDPRFHTALSQRRVTGAGGRALPYSYRLQPGAAPIVFVLPGFGSHRLSAPALALAELAWNRGFSVALVSNAMSWEFIARGASVPVPGYTPTEVANVHFVLDGIVRDLQARHPGRLTGRVLLGSSLGGFDTLFVAAAERAGSPLVGFDRYVAIDAPVRLLPALRKMDGLYDSVLQFPEGERNARVRDILWRALEADAGQRARRGAYSRVALATEPTGRLERPGPLPFSDLEARYLIGLNFRLALVDVIASADDRTELPALQTERSLLHRESAYVEMGRYSFEDYLRGLVLPYYRDQLGLIASLEELAARSDLHSVASELRANPKIRYFANRNDFLTSPEDADWITQTLGAERVRIFPTGGHLGNLHEPEVQAELMRSIADLVEADP
jgi:ABC-type transporter lipoprotein component MlaA